MAIFLKNWQVLGNFLTVKWQFSGGSGHLQGLFSTDHLDVEHGSCSSFGNERDIIDYNLTFDLSTVIKCVQKRLASTYRQHPHTLFTF